MTVETAQQRRLSVATTAIMLILRLSLTFSWQSAVPRWSTSVPRRTKTLCSSQGFSSFCAESTACTTASFTTVSNNSNSSSSLSVVPPRKFVPHPFAYHQEMTLRVETLTNRGFGICRTTLPTSLSLSPVQAVNVGPHDDDDDKDVSVDVAKENAVESSSQRTWVIFVPNVIPGELVKIRIYRNFPNYSEADLMQVLEPSPHRIEQPLCQLAHVCGGCQYQHMTIEAQRHYKTLHTRQALERVGGFDKDVAVLPTVGTSETFYYRSKLTPHYNRPTKIGDTSYEIGPIGFHKKTSRQLVDVDHCPIATHAINDKLAWLRDCKKQEARRGKLKRPKKGATLLLRDAHGGVCVDPNQRVNTTVCGIDFEFVAGNFFQNNPSMLPVLVNAVVDAASADIRQASKESDDAQKGKEKMTHMIDCYCGSGLFCLTAASSFDLCVGIEVNDAAVQEARNNAARNGIENCAFVSASAEAIFESNQPVLLPELLEEQCLVRDFPRNNTVVVLDPPRKGCSAEFLTQLYDFRPQRIVYMSCDPATQARDAKGIVENGYDITSVQPFDLFPQTRHIESLIVFERQQ